MLSSSRLLHKSSTPSLLLLLLLVFVILISFSLLSSHQEQPTQVHMGNGRKDSSSSASADEAFDLRALNKALHAAMTPPPPPTGSPAAAEDGGGLISLPQYIVAFRQLHKFFCMLGSVFSFVGSDVISKIDILQILVDADPAAYATIQGMLSHEVTAGLLTSNKETNGSRTLLRLHRALLFVAKFLALVDKLEDGDGTSKVCKAAYGETLAPFHPWLVQKGAGLAMLALPLKKDLIAKVTGGGAKVTEAELRPLLLDTIGATEKVYNWTQKAYESRGLLELP